MPTVPADSAALEGFPLWCELWLELWVTGRAVLQRHKKHRLVPACKIHLGQSLSFSAARRKARRAVVPFGEGSAHSLSVAKTKVVP